MNTKIITILIMGTMLFATTTVFAGKNYNSSKSNTTSIAQVNKQVGDILLRYYIGGAEINKVTDALAVGISDVDLKATLLAIGINEKGVNEIFSTLDELGTGFIKLDDEEKAISASDAGVTTQAVEKIEIAVEQIKREEVSTSDTGDTKTGVDKATPKLYKAIESASGTGDASTSVVDSFFDVFTELEIFIEVIVKDANITKAEARKVVDALMKVSPAFTIDENGLQDDEEARLIAVVIIGALKSELTAKRALDAFVGATTKSLRGGDRVALVGFGSFSISKRKARTGRIPQQIAIPDEQAERIKAGADLAKIVARVKYSNITLKRGYSAFNDASKDIIQNIKFAAPEERKNLIEELKVNRKTLRTEILSMSLSTRENAEALRENFRENMRATIGHVDHGKTAKIIIAHGKGIRMLNRYNSAIARFDHILGKIESRVLKLEVRDVDTSSVILLIEEAKNMSVKNEAKLEELKAKYEELLLGENSQGIAKEARAIAKDLKTEIQTLHDKLREIVGEIRKNKIDRRDLTKRSVKNPLAVSEEVTNGRS